VSYASYFINVVFLLYSLFLKIKGLIKTLSHNHTFSHFTTHTFYFRTSSEKLQNFKTSLEPKPSTTVGTSSSSQQQAMSVESEATSFIKLRTMALSKEDLCLIIEHVMDFNSLKLNGCYVQPFIEFHNWMPFF